MKKYMAAIIDEPNLMFLIVSEQRNVVVIISVVEEDMTSVDVLTCNNRHIHIYTNKLRYPKLALPAPQGIEY